MPPKTKSLKIEMAGATDIGRRRSQNEDHFFVDKNQQLAVVCDGIGGSPAGEVASALACTVVGQFLGDLGRRAVVPRQRLFEAVRAAHVAVLRHGWLYPSKFGLGTTVVALQVVEDQGVIVHAGDSRAYLLRDGQLRRLTRDHTYAEMVFPGDDVAQYRASFQDEMDWHALTRSLGQYELFRPDLRFIRLRSGDRLMLCTDGLANFFCEPSDAQIREVLRTQRKRSGAVRALVQLALNDGGHDNITVVVIDVV